MICQRCKGNGEIVTDRDRYLCPCPDDPADAGVAECPDCDGTGDDRPSPPEHAALEVQRLHGVEGLRALATFMHAMGSEAVLTYPDPDDPAAEPVWTPCDFVMQHCWALGGTPERRSSDVGPRGAGEERDG